METNNQKYGSILELIAFNYKEKLPEFAKKMKRYKTKKRGKKLENQKSFSIKKAIEKNK